MSPSPITTYHNHVTNNKGYESPVSLLHDYVSHQEPATHFIAKKCGAIYQGDPQSSYKEAQTNPSSEDDFTDESIEDQPPNATGKQSTGFTAYLSQVREGAPEVIRFTFNDFKQLKQMISNDNELLSNSSTLHVYIVKPNKSDLCHISFIEKVQEFSVFFESTNLEVSVVQNQPELTENQPNQQGPCNENNFSSEQDVLIKEELIELDQRPTRTDDNVEIMTRPTLDYNKMLMSASRDFANKARITSPKRDSARIIRQTRLYRNAIKNPRRVYNNAITSPTRVNDNKERMKKIMQNLQQHSLDLSDHSLSKKFLLVRNLIKALKLNLLYGRFESEVERQHRVNQLARAEGALARITIRINGSRVI